MINLVEGGILAAKGYSVASKNIGIKKGNEKRDLTLIKSDVPATVVGTFTRNTVKAAPVKWDMQVVKAGLASAIVINTGIANAATGEEGYSNCMREATKASECLGVPETQVLTMSTGVISYQLSLLKRESEIFRELL